MARYVYEGPGPVEHDGGLYRPGDEHEFGADPDWGPWRALQAPERPAAPPPTPAPAAAPEGPAGTTSAPKDGE